MTRIDIIKELYERYKEDYIIIPIIMNTNLQKWFYDYKVSDSEWKSIQRDLAERFRLDVLYKKLDVKILPKITATFLSLNEKPWTDLTMHSWDYAYYHGTIQRHYDSKDLSPGDLVQCSIDQYRFPLGMYHIAVEQKPAICYTWEDDELRWYLDIDKNSYPRKTRRGLILWLDDDIERHLYAKKCMDERRSSI